MLGQCGGSLADLMYTERLIVELLGTEVMEAAAACNPLAFLRMFHDILLVDFADSGCPPALDLSLLVSKLEVIICQFDFTRFHVSHKTRLLCHSLIGIAHFVLPAVDLWFHCLNLISLSISRFSECTLVVFGMS